MSDPTDPTAPGVPADDADPSDGGIPPTDPDEEPVAEIPEGPLDELEHIGEPLPEDEGGDAGLTDHTPVEGEEE
jgi:hypothetical protein